MQIIAEIDGNYSNTMKENIHDLIKYSKLVFWDFDGVIKDSVEVKSLAFEKLFAIYGPEISKQVRKHHEQNTGLSRFDKIPLYMTWSGELVSDKSVQEFCTKFSYLVKKAIINSPWVPGVREFLIENCRKKFFVLVTATPQKEMVEILSFVNIKECFREVHGAPSKKEDIIRSFLNKQKIMRNKALMIGDSETDFLAAKSNMIPFVLCRSGVNCTFQESYKGISFSSLIKG